MNNAFLALKQLLAPRRVCMVVPCACVMGYVVEPDPPGETLRGPLGGCDPICAHALLCWGCLLPRRTAVAPICAHARAATRMKGQQDAISYVFCSTSWLSKCDSASTVCRTGLAGRMPRLKVMLVLAATG